MRRPKLKYKQDYESDSEEEDEQKLHHIAKYSIICLTIFIFCMGLLFAGIHFSLNQVGKLKGRHDDSTSNHLGWLTSELEVVSHQLTRSREYIIAAKGILHSNWMQDTTHHGDGVTKAPPLSIPKEQQPQQQQPQQQQPPPQPQQQQQQGDQQYCGNPNPMYDNTRIMIVPETDLPGGDISMGPSPAQNQLECCIECSNTKECIAFTWVISSKQCWLKKQTAQRNSNPGTVSGILPHAEAAIHAETAEFELLIKKYKKQNVALNNNGMMSVWPMPQQINYEGSPRLIASNFHFIILTPAFQRIQKTLTRYEQKIKGQTKRKTFETLTGKPLTTINIYCNNCKDHEDHDDAHFFETDAAYASYKLDVSCGTSCLGTTQLSTSDGTLEAESYAGLIAGLNTLSQICFGGLCNTTKLSIIDRAQYKYRGLLLDTGRRFVTVPVLRVIMGLMVTLHMNVLHLHLSDWSAVRFKSSVFPALEMGATNSPHRQYSDSDIQQLKEFAKDRGIIIVPEIDVPGHASSFRPLESVDGVKFCSSLKFQLWNDPEKLTLNTLKLLVKEMASKFDSPIFHVGGDETKELGNCKTSDIQELTKSMQEHVKALGKIPMAWNEIVTDLHVQGHLDTIIQCWNNCDVAAIARQGHRVIYSKMHDFYLDFVSQTCTLQGSLRGACLWKDIAESFSQDSEEELPLLLGGSAAMWNDEYCPKSKCVGHGDGWGGKMGFMYPKAQDNSFAKSFLAVIFPRLSLVAGSLWHWEKISDKSFINRRLHDKDRPLEVLIQDYAVSAARLEIEMQRLIKLEKVDDVVVNQDEESVSCPWDCKGGCTMQSRCGVAYRPQ